MCSKDSLLVLVEGLLVKSNTKLDAWIYLKKLLSHLLTFIQSAIVKVSDAKDKELNVVATYHTKLIKKVESEKENQCAQEEYTGQ